VFSGAEEWIGMFEGNFSLRKMVCNTGWLLALASGLLAGCAGNVSNVSEYSNQPKIRPDNIYVYSFGIAPHEVKSDSGIISKLESHFSGGSSMQAQSAEALGVQQEVANEIVERLRSMGLRATRSNIPAPAGQNVLMVKGVFEGVDAGNRTRRVMVGFGAGESEVNTSVQLLYKPAGGRERLVQRFDTAAHSRKMPGIVEAAGLGAVTGGLGTSVAVGGALHGVSETTHDDVSDDAKRMADSIATQVAQIGVEQGWLSSDRVN